MKLTKTKKIILLGVSIGILTTAIVVPVMFLGEDENNQEKQNQKDVDQIVKILEEKSEDEKIITLPSDTTGKIIANNQEKIVAKIKTLIGEANLKEVKIQVTMVQDQNILITKKEIIITISKEKYSKTIASAKAYFVKREQNDQEITVDINSVKTALNNLTSKAKALKLFIKKADKSINANKDAILKTLKEVEGYSEIDFKEVKIKVKNDTRNLPLSNQSPINIIFVLSKGNVTPVEINIFTIKQLDSDEFTRINNELNRIKSSLEGLSPKILEVDAPSSNKTITHNKGAIKNAIQNLSGYNSIDFGKVFLEIKDSNNDLPSNDQVAISIILVLSKNNVNLEVQGFSAKQMLFSTTINNEIIAIKTILDGISGQDLIITLLSNSTGNIIGNVSNKNAIIKKLRILINPSNSNGEANHSSLRGTTIEVSMNIDRPISKTAQDIIIAISKSGGRTLRTRKTFQVKRELTIEEINEDIAAIKAILDAKDKNSDPNLEIVLESSSSGSIINNPINKNAIERKIRKVIDPSNTSGDPNHPSLRGTTITLTRVIYTPEQGDSISTFRRLIIITISKSGGRSLNFSGFIVRKSST